MREVALASPGRRAETEEAVIAELLDDVTKQQSESFDLDDPDVPSADELPESLRPPAVYDLASLGTLLTRAVLLPPGTEVKRIAKGEYNLSAPGVDAVRITTRRQLFEEHPASFELWSPGSPAFPGPEWGPPAKDNDQDLEATTLDELLAKK